MAADVRIGQKEIARFDAYLPLGKFNLPRSLGEKPIFPNKPTNSDTSPDLSWSLRHAAINVAAISTRNLSALVSQKPRSRISSHASLTDFGRLGRSSGSAVYIHGSNLRLRFGFLLKAPRNSSTAVGVRYVPI
jgi:hypothetical protein